MNWIKRLMEIKEEQLEYEARQDLYMRQIAVTITEILEELKIIKNIKVDKNIKKTLDAIDKWRNHIELKGGKKKWKK